MSFNQLTHQSSTAAISPQLQSTRSWHRRLWCCLGGLLISRDATCVQIFCLLVSLSLPLSSSAFNVADQNPAHISSRQGRRLLRTTASTSRVYSLGLLRFLLSVMSARTRNCNTARPSDRLTRKAVSSRETTHASLTPRTEER